MQEDFLTRTRILLGDEKVEKIRKSRFVLFGVGGVGSYALEALVRAGVGEITLVDYDTINITNLNRQLIALTDNLGRLKVEVAAERAKKIQPEIRLHLFPQRVDRNNVNQCIPLDTTYVIDAIDDIPGKVGILQYCVTHSIPVISSMGTGNRTCFKNYKITDITKTHGCPLARKLRKALKENGVHGGVSVLFSPETPDIVVSDRNIGSISFVPAQAGLRLAQKVINEIIG